MFTGHNASDLLLNCSSEGNPPPRYRWIHEGEIISEKSNVKIHNVLDAALYICTADNIVGQLSSSTVTNEQCK